MKIGTVKWFNLRKGYGIIHPDDGGRNIFVHMSAVEIAGMNDLKEGQRVIFEIQRDERTGNASAVSLKAVVFATRRISMAVIKAARSSRTRPRPPTSSGRPTSPISRSRAGAGTISPRCWTTSRASLSPGSSVRP
jgi:cold shock protein